MKISIDPGAHTGIAYWQGDKLFRAQTLQAPLLLGALRDARPVAVAIEWPSYYPGSPANATSIQRLIEAAAQAEAWAVAEGAVVSRVSVPSWKGSLPKHICRRRIRRVLSPSELPLLDGQRHDAWDAVGVGLVWLGRCGRGLA